MSGSCAAGGAGARRPGRCAAAPAGAAAPAEVLAAWKRVAVFAIGVGCPPTPGCAPVAVPAGATALRGSRA